MRERTHIHKHTHAQVRVQTAYILLGTNSSMLLHNFTPLGLDTTTMHSCTLRLSLHPTGKPPTALRTLRDGQAQLRKRCVSLTGCSAPLGAGGSAPPVRQGFVARCKWRREGINVQRRDKPAAAAGTRVDDWAGRSHTHRVRALRRCRLH